MPIVNASGQFVGGWLRDSEDRVWLAKNATAAMPCKASDIDLASLPKSLGIRDWLKIEQQGQQGSCGGHMNSSLMECAYYHATKTAIQFSRAFAYAVARKIDKIVGDEGSTIAGQAKASRDFGICREETLPYNDKIVLDWRRPWAVTQPMYEEAAKFKMRRFTQLRSYGDVLAWLATRQGGVGFGVDWCSFCQNPRNGTIDRYRFENVGGHAVPVVDWNTDFRDGEGRPYLDLPNSHGPQYGDRGWVRVAPSVIDQWCQGRNGEIAIGWSDMSVPTLRNYQWGDKKFLA